MRLRSWKLCLMMTFTQIDTFLPVPAGSPSRVVDVAVYVFDKKSPTELAHSFSFCSCVWFCPYGPFNSVSFHKFPRQLSAFSLCPSGLISALLVLSTAYLCMKVSFSPDIIHSGWLGFKHHLTNQLSCQFLWPWSNVTMTGSRMANFCNWWCLGKLVKFKFFLFLARALFDTRYFFRGF